MRSFKALILGLICFCILFKNIQGSCSVNIGDPAPRLINHFGTKHLLSDTHNSITADNNEHIDLYCSQGFYVHRNYNGATQYKAKVIKIMCNSNGHFYYNGENINQINCLGTQNAEMYESDKPMTDCPYMSLVVGQKFEEYGSIKKVGICYDFDAFKVKYIGYTAYPAKSNIFEATQVGQLNDVNMDHEIIYKPSLFKAISASSFKDALRKATKFITPETYELDNLIQDEAFAKEISSFQEMLQVIWFRALRVGNWRHMLSALHVASLEAKYDVNVGVSGIIELPSMGICNQTIALNIELDSDYTIIVPSHIWAHVKAIDSTDSAGDEFVFVAQNTPFVTRKENLGICESMCHEIDWLKNSAFGKLHKYPAYGLVQCCRVEDVENKLDNFPNLPKPKAEPEETTQVSEE